MITYCDYCISHPQDVHIRTYHDKEYGFPLQNDNLLFERLILEINPAGLSWITIIKEADKFKTAYSRFEVDMVAAYI